MPDNQELLKRITARPDVFGGKPIIRDMRISVELILSLLSQGATITELLDDYPGLEPEDIRACVAYAHAVIAGDTLGTVFNHAGLIRLPDVRAPQRIEIVSGVIDLYGLELEERAMIKVQGRRVRVYRPPES